MAWGPFKLYDWFKSRRTPAWLKTLGDNLPPRLEIYLLALMKEIIQLSFDKGMTLSDLSKDPTIKSKVEQYKKVIMDTIKNMA